MSCRHSSPRFRENASSSCGALPVVVESAAPTNKSHIRRVITVASSACRSNACFRSTSEAVSTGNDSSVKQNFGGLAPECNLLYLVLLRRDAKGLDLVAPRDA